MNEALLSLETRDEERGMHTMVHVLTKNLLKEPREMIFDISEYEKTVKGGSAALFTEINKFFATLPIESQEKIATCYGQMAELFEESFSIQAIKEGAQTIVKDMYSVISYADVLQWVQYSIRPRKPPTVNAEYLPEDPPDRRRTYIFSEYIEIVALAAYLRPMIPIWGEYILRIKKEVGTDFKEREALKLLYKIDIMNLRPIRRLVDYIDAITGYERPVFASVIQGLGTDERVSWLLALNLIRRVATGEIVTADEESNIVTNVHNFTKTKFDGLGKKMNVRDSEKESAKSGEDNSSLIENHKVKEKVTKSDMAATEHYASDPYKMALRVDPNLDLGKLKLCIDTIAALPGHPSRLHQKVLAAWVLGKVIPGRSVESLGAGAGGRRAVLMSTLAVTQALLWHWGFYNLAALVTAVPFKMEDDQILSNLDGKSRIPKEMQDTLAVLYKHHEIPTKAWMRTRAASGRLPNYAITAIDNVVALINGDDWELFAPKALIDLTSRIPHTKRLIVPADIKAQLAALVINVVAV